MKNIFNYYFLYYYDEDIKKIIADYKLKNRKGLSREISILIKKTFKGTDTRKKNKYSDTSSNKQKQNERKRI